MSSKGETIVYLPPVAATCTAIRFVTCPFLRVNVADVCLRPQEVTPDKLELPIPEVPADEDEFVVSNLPYNHVEHLLYHCLSKVLVRLIPYQAQLYKVCGSCDGARKILKSLISGLTDKNATKICIEGLIIATMEMTPLVKPSFIYNIIRNIAQIAAGRHLAIATLSFLSVVSLNPQLYRDFTEEEYKVVISVILPYTDPVKYDVYVIHFAHVVVCNWYVRCHYKHRPAFKDYILSQLRSAVKSAEQRKPRAESSHQDPPNKERRKISTESKDSRGLRPKSGDFGRHSSVASARANFRKVPSTDSINKLLPFYSRVVVD
eukprot:sb/3466878/